MMPEPEPPRVGARRARDDLVPEADPQQRPAVLDDRPCEGDGAGEPRRVAGTGREDDAIDVRREHLVRRRRVWQQPDTRAAAAERPDDVHLEPVVDDRVICAL